MLQLVDAPKKLEDAICCLCFPLKLGLWIICIVNILEEVFAIPEIFELNSPLYTIYLLLSLVIGCLNIWFQLKWFKQDNKESRVALIKAFQIKWVEQAFDAVAHLIFLATLSEEDFFKYTRGKNDPYKHSDYSGKY